MVYVAVDTDGNEVLAADVADSNDEYYCVNCGESVTYVKSHQKQSGFWSAHYRHGGGESCGEGELHRKLKSIAVSDISNSLGGLVDAAYTEDDPNNEALKVADDTESDAIWREPDAVLEFNDSYSLPGYGKGILLEIQVSNKSKEVDRVTEIYLKNSWSVLWLEPSDFAEERSLRYDDFDHIKEMVETPWPDLPELVIDRENGGRIDSGFRYRNHPYSFDAMYYDGPFDRDLSRSDVLCYYEFDDECISWTNQGVGPVLPPEAVVEYIGYDIESLVDDSLYPSIDSDDEVDDDLENMVVSIITEAEIDIASWVNESGDYRSDLRSSWEKGVDKRFENKEISEIFEYIEKEYPASKSVWHAVDSDPRLYIHFNGNDYDSFSDFKIEYERLNRDIEPFGRELLEGAAIVGDGSPATKRSMVRRFTW